MSAFGSSSLKPGTRRNHELGGIALEARGEKKDLRRITNELPEGRASNVMRGSGLAG